MWVMLSQRNCNHSTFSSTIGPTKVNFMAPRNTDNTPAPDVYVALLFVSLSALIMGVVMLVLELGKYGWKMAP